MAFDNILQAVTSTQTQTSYPTALTNQQIVDNHRAFEELQRSGVYIPDLMKRIDSLEAQMKSMSEPKVDPDLFPMMEAAVRDDPKVMERKQAVDDARQKVLNEFVIKDPRVADAVKAYRDTVRTRYLETTRKGPEVPDEGG
ncbi:MAG: hypothetical protein IJ469_02520 [Candidatus Methanomethylophilaceae archaeon]|nr:hypothetical protein [Candidatus Methanomethylophilaceae archaeon]